MMHQAGGRAARPDRGRLPRRHGGRAGASGRGVRGPIRVVSEEERPPTTGRPCPRRSSPGPGSRRRPRSRRARGARPGLVPRMSGHRSRSRRAHRFASTIGTAARLRRPGHRHRCPSSPAARRGRARRACTCSARSTTASPCAPISRPGPGRVVVVGAGFIGAEVAATCRGRGLDVTLLEAMPVPLEQALGRRDGRRVRRDPPRPRRRRASRDGCRGLRRHATGSSRSAWPTARRWTADVVVVGIGVRPATSGWRAAGLTLDNGIVCDATCLAAPGVVAAGDVARWPNHRFGAGHAGRALGQRPRAGCGRRPPPAGRRRRPGESFEPVPWFWSDQYDRKIQLAGRPGFEDEVQVVEGSVEERRFVALYGAPGPPGGGVRDEPAPPCHAVPGAHRRAA